jgi:Cu(I)/Ag(I) efflux system membrane fusion protein
MKKLVIILPVLFILVFTSCNNSSKTTTESKTAVDTTKTSNAYICPMDSDVVSDKPGVCPKCGMDLEKKN